MLVLATVPVHETSLANQHFYSTLLGRGRRYVKEYSLYACENAENYGWSLTNDPTTFYIHICDRICEKGSYTRIQFCDFKDV